MSNVYIFGVSPFAEMLRLYLNDSDDTFSGYVVDAQYMPTVNTKGDPVFSWDDFLANTNPDNCKVLSSVTYKKMNTARERLYNRIIGAGYSLASYVHPSAVVAPDCILGPGSIILENCTLQPGVVLGKNNVIWSNVNICHHTTIGDFNFFAASSTVLGHVHIEDRCFIGCGAIVRNRITVKSGTLVGASAFLGEDSNENSVIMPPRSVFIEKDPLELHL